MAWWNRSLTASVTAVPAKKTLARKTGETQSRSWQEAAWGYYADLGEVRYAANYVGNSLSRCRFFVGTINRPGDTPVPVTDDNPAWEQEAARHMDRLRGRDGTLQSLVRVYGKQQFVAGESYLVGTEGVKGDRWEMLSPSELRRLQGTAGVRVKGDGDEEPLPDTALVLRIWQRHPQHSLLPDSPMRGVLDICEALRTAQAMQNVSDKSQLATAGLFLVPAEADLPTVVEQVGEQRGSRLRLADDLLGAMEEAISDPSSAAALVPIMLTVKGDTVEKFRRVSFERAVDESIATRIDHLIRRLAQGIDLPPERLLGTEDSNHWSSWAVAEDTVRVHIAPLAESFCEDLTYGFLHPAMEAAGASAEETARMVVWYDPSPLTLNPNRSKDAVQAFDRFALSWEALVRELGFAEEDMPDADEIAARVALLGGPPPMPTAGHGKPPQGQEDVSPGVPATGPQEKEGKAATRRALYLGACDMAVERALEKAGARIRSRANGKSSLGDLVAGQQSSLIAAMLGPGQVAALGLDDDALLDGAWGGLEKRLASWSGNPVEAAALVAAVDQVARRRLFDPSVDVHGALAAACDRTCG